MPDFADDPSSELARKAKALSVVALVETFTYLLLFYFWQIVPNQAGTAIVGSIHGMVWLAFCAMTIMITPEMRWSWWYTAFVIVTGPIGAVVAWHRLRGGVPDHHAQWSATRGQAPESGRSATPSPPSG